MRTGTTVRAAAVGAATLMLITACGDGGGADGGTPDAELSLVTGVYPLEWLAGQVGGDRVSVTQLTEPGAEPHDLELTGRQLGEVTDADLAFYVSGLQPAVDEAVEQQAPDTALDVADVIELHPVAEGGGHDHSDDEHAEESHDHSEEGHDHAEDDHSDDEGHSEEEHSEEEHGHSDDEHAEESHSDETHEEDHAEEGGDGHDHGEFDPHFWLDVDLMAETARALADRMAEIDPEGAATYTDNAEAVAAELAAIGQEYDEGLASCTHSEVAVGHTAFSYLTEAYGLEQIGVSGIDPDTDPSPSQIAAIADTVEELGIGTVFTEPLMPPETAETIAAESGAEVAVLDPLEGVTEDSPGDDYPSIMRGNLEALTAALECS
ncbi:metal ABC transporter solute-binding protein, Zn/Mn family [Nocardiopsis sp. CNT312]|uniref:metal ABC transporter solute-binding protein, Zn/Mn family n=1 Tax=Nocardiopsis sp. CNT312 TaxID=1137268 RepID=UPI00056A048C|nr:zinc ABC transporter substrate-binding protein [Nocardiopsis sp. CNT312]